VYTRQNAASPNLPGGSINLTLEIPPGLDIEVTNENGEVTADKIAARLNVRTSNGAVMIGGLDGDLEVRGENGRITVHDVGGKVRVSTGNGQIRVENPRGEVALDSQNGEIELSSDHPLDKTYSLRTKNGRIRFSLPKESNLEIEARTSHGQISGLDQEFSTGSGPAGSARLKLGGGKGNARLSTENGPISVMTN
ncbi:MAG: DUF4097 domain-containing protein, partial [Firmicutes bacterium]|nr:DUF4097 domain-containing protein [Bacillota bacterium]